MSVAFAVVALVATAAGAPAAPAPPAGWVTRPFPPRASPEWHCANHSDGWEVSIENGRLRVSPQAKERRPPEPLPFTPTPAADEKPELFEGDRHVRRVSDGFLVGFNRGEFGGGLYWFSPDGRTHRAVNPGDVSYHPLNVRAILGADDTFYVFQGLSHLTRSRGRVLAVRREAKAGWTARVLADLDAAPAAVASAGPDAWLVALSRGVARVDRSGKVDRLWTEPGVGPLYPSSIARTSDGTIYVGMRAWIVRLIPAAAPAPPAADLLAPAGCRHLIKNQDSSRTMSRGLFGDGEKFAHRIPCRCADEPGREP